MSGRARRLALTVVVAASAPAALAIESLTHDLLTSPEAEELRSFFSGTLTLVGWGLAAASVVFVLVGLAMRRIMISRVLSAHAAGRLEKPLERVVLDRFLLSSSVPQIPAVASTVVVMLGSAIAPAIVAVSISSLGILAQWVSLERHLHRSALPLDPSSARSGASPPAGA